MNASYAYNFKGERVSKTSNGQTTHYIYNTQGQLIAEADSTATLTQEYLYLNRQRLATIANGVIYYVHTNQLDAPIALTDQAGLIQWQAHYTPFGKAIVDINNLTTASQNQRFPGQYFDSETGMHYNYFRDYDAEIGRYLESDPIGLNGGMSTFGYVGGNPVNTVDPSGLKCVSINGTTTCTPENNVFRPYSFKTPVGWEDFESSDFLFHKYMFIDYVGNINGCDYGSYLKDELIKSPTNDSHAATIKGNINNVGPLHPFSGSDNVTSYRTPRGILNVTEENHAVGSGFVMRRIIKIYGGYAILVYGEGNSWKQTVWGAEGKAKKFWTRNANRISNRALSHCSCEE